VPDEKSVCERDDSSERTFRENKQAGRKQQSSCDEDKNFLFHNLVLSNDFPNNVGNFFRHVGGESYSGNTHDEKQP